VLENNCDDERSLTYFKWFSVIFHVIIINVQETILPSVVIDSLNNHPEYGDWFYDAVTTRGISFDGMMPHACKFPLGRTKPTEKKPWKTALIQTVTDMLQYLNSEVILKNGYHLGDILTKICFVYGNSSVYKAFEAGVNAVVENQVKDQLPQLKHQVLEDLQKFAVSLHVKKRARHDKINIKIEMYRSVTLFISALGRYYKVCASSCFEIILVLHQKSDIDKVTEIKLMYAVAVACEIRMIEVVHESKTTN